MTLPHHSEIEALAWEHEIPAGPSAPSEHLDANELARKLARELKDNFDSQLDEIVNQHKLVSKGHGFSTYVLQEICDYRLGRDHALRVLLYLRFRQGKNPDTFVAEDTIATHLGISETTVKRAIATLSDCGWLINTKRVGTTTLRTVVHPSKIYGDLSMIGLTNKSKDCDRLTSADKPKPNSWTIRDMNRKTYQKQKNITVRSAGS